MNPFQLEKIRNHLLFTPNFWNFQLWTMILISVKLALRSFEVCQLAFSDVVNSLTIVKGNVVEGICLKIYGKSDPRPIHLYLWNDDIHPQFCAVRHLLVWIALTRIRLNQKSWIAILNQTITLFTFFLPFMP